MKKKLLIVDDSPLIHKVLKKIISNFQEFEVVAACLDPYEASAVLENQKIDGIILDLELPKMDGKTFLMKLRQSIDMPVMIFSSAISSESGALKKTLENCGAKGFLSKEDLKDLSAFEPVLKKSLFQLFNLNQETGEFEKLILIAASTGGPEGVKKITDALPENSRYAVIVVQHMPGYYTKNFALNLNKTSAYTVQEAESGQVILPHNIYIAPGDFHLKIFRSVGKSKYFFAVVKEEAVHSVRPAADVTFLTLPTDLASKSIVVVLSGMGKDGAAGAAHLKKRGAKVLAESEESAFVFGMPKETIATGCVDLVLSIEEIEEYFRSKEKSYKKIS